MSTGRRQDFCQVCKKQVDRDKLTWRIVKFYEPEQENLLAYSEYNSLGWAATQNPEFTAWGILGDLRYPIFDSSYNVTWNDGLAAFDGSATARTTSGVDASTWATGCISVWVGPHQTSTTPSVTYVIGVCSEDGGTKVPLATVTTKFKRRIIAPFTLAEISTLDTTAICFYIMATATGKWWFERAQLEADVVWAGREIGTSGTAVPYTAAQDSQSMAKVCPACREDIPDDPKYDEMTAANIEANAEAEAVLISGENEVEV